MNYINDVKLSGVITEIRTSERGSRFLILKQVNVHSDGVEHSRYLELFVNADRDDIIKQIVTGRGAEITGKLTTFKAKKINIYKMIVEVETFKLI
ncbi:MAG: hypothetical protein LBD05_00235 [Mycoplasmataceae bacterium]|jgi:hypothetical protein|nr:hypothetical protein [Mycoplasmataceae bacterium]